MSLRDKISANLMLANSFSKSQKTRIGSKHELPTFFEAVVYLQCEGHSTSTIYKCEREKFIYWKTLALFRPAFASITLALVSYPSDNEEKIDLEVFPSSK